MIGRLERVAQFGAEGTLGILELGELRQWALEPPWLANARGSRIPPGFEYLNAVFQTLVLTRHFDGHTGNLGHCLDKVDIFYGGFPWLIRVDPQRPQWMVPHDDGNG